MARYPFAPAALLLVLVALVAVGVAARPAPPTAPGAAPSVTAPPGPVTTAPPSATPTPDTATLLAVGDIATCGGDHDEQVAALVGRAPGTVALLGDIAYENGSARDLRDCFEPAWRPLRDRLRPVPGNHDYRTRNAAPYFDYFGAAAGTRGEGWYAYDLAGWRVYALNSDCDAVGGCGEGSPQLEWLGADLAANPRACTLAYWHHARWSSGEHGGIDATDPFWRTLADAGADVVLAGHEHDYERFVPLDAEGRPSDGGVRSFVVGTGGRSLRGFPNVMPTSEVRDNAHDGVLRLDLRADGYHWEFLATDGSRVDEGSGACH